jgi:hypothetical protein
MLHPRNVETAAMLNATIAHDYTRMATLPDLYAPRQQLLYVRNDLLPHPGTSPTDGPH